MGCSWVEGLSGPVEHKGPVVVKFGVGLRIEIPSTEPETPYVDAEPQNQNANQTLGPKPSINPINTKPCRSCIDP